MKFNDSIVLETATLTLRVVFRNARIERIEDRVLCISPDSLDLEITLNGRVVCLVTFQAIGSFIPKERIARNYGWFRQVLSEPTREENKILKSELSSALGIPIDFVSGAINQYAQNELLNRATFLSDVFAQRLRLIIEKHTPKAEKLDSILESLRFTRRYGEVPWHAGSLSVELEEFWLHGNDEPIESCFEFTFGDDNRIELTAIPRFPVGRVPLNNCFEISVTKASACLKSQDYYRLVHNVTPLIVHEHIKPDVFPKDSGDKEWFNLEAGGDPRDFPGRDTLEQRLELLVDQEYERAEAENWEPLTPMCVSETAPMFQFAYGALEHLWTQPCQLSVMKSSYPEFSGLINVKKLIFAKFESSLKKASASDGFHIALLLAFEKDEGDAFIVAAGSWGSGYITWESSDSITEIKSSRSFLQGISDELFHALEEALSKI